MECGMCTAFPMRVGASSTLANIRGKICARLGYNAVVGSDREGRIPVEMCCPWVGMVLELCLLTNPWRERLFI
jgi:hypothetical protein